jgi:hypothetical protein
MLPKFSHLASEAHRYSRTEIWRGHQAESLPNVFGRIIIGETIHKLFFDKFIKQFPDYEYLDSGNQAVVLASLDQRNVLKILVNSSTFNKKEAISRSLAYQQLSDSARYHLGDQWLDSIFDPVHIKTLPFMLPGYSVAVHQAWMEDGGSRISVEEHLVQDPEIAPELLSLIRNIRAFHNETGIYPDIRWPKNLICVKEGPQRGFRIIDTNLSPGGANMHRVIPAKGRTVEEDIAKRLEQMEKLASVCL